MSRTVRVGTSNSGTSAVTTTEEYDRQGRLWMVTEAAGSASAAVTGTPTK